MTQEKKTTHTPGSTNNHKGDTHSSSKTPAEKPAREKDGANDRSNPRAEDKHEVKPTADVARTTANKPADPKGPRKA